MTRIGGRKWQALASFSWLLMDKLVALGGAAIVNIVIARHLGPYDFGLLNYVVSMAALAAAVGGLGITGQLMRELAYDPDDEPQLLGSASVFTPSATPIRKLAVHIFTIYITQL